jgi:hypothetical protein
MKKLINKLKCYLYGCDSDWIETNYSCIYQGKLVKKFQKVEYRCKQCNRRI